MPEIGRIWSDGDDVRLTDGDGEYLKFPGDTVEAEAPDPPEAFAYNKSTGALTWDDHPDAAEYRIKGNAKTGGPYGTRTRAVATVNAPTLTTNDGALGSSDNRSYGIRSYCDYAEIEGPEAVIYASAAGQKL